MTNYTWTSAVSGTWSQSADWTPTGAPGASDTATISVGGTYTVTLAAATKVQALTVADGNATLAMNAALTVGTLTATDGTFALGLGQTLAVTGTATFDAPNSYGPVVTGPGTLSTAGATTLATQSGGYIDLYIGGGATWINSGNATIGGIIDVGTFAYDRASFVNQAGAVFNLTTDYAGINPYTSYDSSVFSNAGTLEKTGGTGTGTSTITSVINNTGTISASNGTLAFTGGGTLGGTLATTSTGTIALANGTFTLAAATVSGSLLLDGGTLTLAASQSIAGPFSATSGTIQLGSGQTLTLDAAASFGLLNNNGPIVTGPGTLTTKGTTTLAGQSGGANDLYVGGGATWINAGNATIGGYIRAGIGSYDTASFVNQAGSIFNLTNDLAGIYPNNNNDTASFTNAGTLEKTGGTGVGTSVINATIANTGTISASNGTLAFNDGGTLGGKLLTTSTGTIALSAGTFTLVNATVSGSLLLNGGTMTLAASQSIAGPFSATSGTIQLGSGQTLTLDAAASFGLLNNNGPIVTGPGTLTTKGTTTLAGQSGGANDLYVGGGATWINAGNATIGGYIRAGIGSYDTASFVNQAGSIFNLTNDLAGIYPNNNYDAASFTNAGTLEKTGGTGAGTSVINATIANTGTISASNGTLAFNDGGTLGGKLLTTSTGTIALSAGTFTLVNATVSGSLLLSGGNLALAASQSITGPFAAARGTVQLALGQTLTLTGAASFDTTNSNGPTVTGPGTIVTTGATTLAAQTGGYVDLSLGGGVTWNNSGTATIGGYVYVGTGSNDTASFINQVGAVFNLTSDLSDIYINNNFGPSVFSNAGLLEKTGGTGTGTSTISSVIDNTGTISASDGTLAFNGGGSLAGTLTTTSSGTIALSAGTFTLSSATVSGALLLNGSGATLALAKSQSITGAFAATHGTIQLGLGQTLTLSGSASFDTTNNYGPTVAGPGTLSTKGATTLAAQTGGYVDLSLGGGVTWNNSGTATIGGYVYAGTGSYDSASFINQASGVFNLTNDLAGIYSYSNNNDASVFTNAGLLEKTGGTGTGTSTIASVINNTGTISADDGTLAFTGGGTLGGKLLTTASGTIALEAGTFTLSSATVSGALLLNGYNATLTLAKSQSITGSFTATHGTIQLGYGQTLTLSGSASFDTTNNYGPSIAGPGTIATTGTTTLAAQTGGYIDVYIGGGATWINSGNATIGGYVYAGLVANDTATFVNQAGATFNLTNDLANINQGASNATSVFTNAGLLEKTGGSGTGTSTITSVVTNTGTIAVTNGTLSLPRLTNLAGTTLTGGTYSITGASTLQLANNVTITTLSASVILNGTGSTLQSLNTSSNTQIGIETTLTTITAAGSLSLYGGRGYTSTQTITDNGQIVLHGGTFTSAGTLTVGATGALRGYGTISPAVANAGLLDATGGTLAVTGAVTGSGALEADAGSTLQLNRAALTSITGKVTLNGAGSDIVFGTASPFTTLESSLTGIAAGGSFSVLGGRGYVTSKVLTDSGVFTVAGGTFTAASLTVTTSGRILGSGTFSNAIANAGTIEANGGLLKLSAGATGSGKLLVDAGATLELAAATSAGASTDNGILLLDGQTLSGTAALTVGATGTVRGLGVIKQAVANSGLLDAQGSGTLALTGAVSGAGALEADAGATLQLNEAALTSITGAVTLNGAGSKIVFGAASPFTALESSLTGIASTGSFSVLGGRGYVTTRALSDSGLFTVAGGTFTAVSLSIAATGRVVGSGTFTNAISNAGTIGATGGTLTLNGALTDTGTLSAASGAVLAASGGGAISGAVTGAGTLSLSGASAFTTGGTLDIGTAVINAATVSVGSGTLAFLGAVTNNGTIAAGGNTASFASSVGGTGSISIGAGGTASLLAGSGSGETLKFLATSGTLGLGTPLAFAGSISGFVAGDSIDLLSTIATGKSFSGGVLTLTGSGGTVAALHFAGSYTTGSFTIGTDSHGGTLITHS